MSEQTTAYPSDNSWFIFVDWAARFRQLPNYELDEEQFKSRIAGALRNNVLPLLRSGDKRWIAKLRTAFNMPPHIVYRFQHQRFTNWCSDQPSTTRELLLDLWDGRSGALTRFDAFIDSLPQEVLSGTGNRTNLGSFLLLGLKNYRNYPPFRARAFAKAYELVGFEADPKMREPGKYRAALQFLDIFRSKAAARGLQLADRLDAQGTVWCMYNWSIPADWPPLVREEFRLYRKDAAATEKDYEVAVSDRHFDPTDDLDQPHTAAGRKEQRFLRDQLFHAKPTAKCAICRRALPVNLLVAAHIKPRAKCTNQERLDWRHIVMAACRLGCDDLYELGYLYVDRKGSIRLSSKSSAVVQDYARAVQMVGRTVEGWPTGRKYFDWHRMHVEG